MKSKKKSSNKRGRRARRSPQHSSQKKRSDSRRPRRRRRQQQLEYRAGSGDNNNFKASSSKDATQVRQQGEQSAAGSSIPSVLDTDAWSQFLPVDVKLEYQVLCDVLGLNSTLAAPEALTLFVHSSMTLVREFLQTRNEELKSQVEGNQKLVRFIRAYMRNKTFAKELLTTSVGFELNTVRRCDTLGTHHWYPCDIAPYVVELACFAVRMQIGIRHYDATVTSKIRFNGLEVSLMNLRIQNDRAAHTAHGGQFIAFVFDDGHLQPPQVTRQISESALQECNLHEHSSYTFAGQQIGNEEGNVTLVTFKLNRFRSNATYDGDVELVSCP